MQNVQNATEIQQRVINLVNLYRTKVGWESQIAKEAKEEWDFWNQSLDMMAIESMAGGIYGEGPHTEEWVKHLMVNEQLLGHFYAEVAGDNADKDVLAELLPDVYDKTIFTEEDESFLKKHFKEMVNYIILTPCDESLIYVHRDDRKDIMTIPDEVLEFINTRIKVPTGSQIYNPFTGFAQFTSLFKGCKFFCDDKNPWMQVAIYANEVDAEIVGNDFVPSSYNAIVSYIYESGDTDCKTATHLCEAYKNLISDGTMLLLCPPRFLTHEDYSPLRQLLIKDGAIKEIIQLPHVMGNDGDSYCLLIAVKGRHEKHVTLIDARVASEKLNSKHYMLSFNIAKFNAILENDGKDPNTGLRKMVKVSSEVLSPDILIPQVHVIERPSETEHPVPLSTLCSLVAKRIRDVQFDLPEDTPWISMGDLTPLFTGDMDLSTIRKADCPNNPLLVEGSNDYGFDKDGKFVDSIWSQMGKTKGHIVLDYRRCTYLSGNCDAVLYNRSAEFEGQVAVVRATGNPYAVSSGILAFCPKDNYDANSLAALLRLPIVYRQLIAYQEYGIGKHLDDIIVPLDKRIIGDELYQMKKEESVTNELADNFSVAQKKHKEKLENYQHAMRKPSQQIGSAVRRMERFVNEMDSSEEIKSYLLQRLGRIKDQRQYLSEDIERLNEENTYGEPSPYDIDHSLRNYREYFGYDVCPIKYTNVIANDTFRKYRQEHQEMLKVLDEKSRSKELEAALARSSMAYADIAEYNFGKIVRNILENAKKHGFDDFTDVNRDDCIIEISLNWDKERQMYRIDFRNNGNPLPEGLTKASYGENRKYAGRTGGTGIGGYEVAENVKHYNGDYAISQDGDWVVVSIYLPKSKTYDERL